MISETKKREIEAMLNEYEGDLRAYHKWLQDWRQRQRRYRFQRGSEAAADEVPGGFVHVSEPLAKVIKDLKARVQARRKRGDLGD